MGSLEKYKDSWALEDSSYWAIMGGVELDLRKAEIADKEYFITCNAIMGGIEIIVPKDISVKCEGIAILGGVDLLGESTGGIISSLRVEQISQEKAAIINIYSRALMGGIEIKVKG